MSRIGTWLSPSSRSSRERMIFRFKPPFCAGLHQVAQPAAGKVPATTNTSVARYGSGDLAHVLQSAEDGNLAQPRCPCRRRRWPAGRGPDRASDNATGFDGPECRWRDRCPPAVPSGSPCRRASAARFRGTSASLPARRPASRWSSGSRGSARRGEFAATSRKKKFAAARTNSDDRRRAKQGRQIGERHVTPPAVELRQETEHQQFQADHPRQRGPEQGRGTPAARRNRTATCTPASRRRRRRRRASAPKTKIAESTNCPTMWRTLPATHDRSTPRSIAADRRAAVSGRRQTRLVVVGASSSVLRRCVLIPCGCRGESRSRKRLSQRSPRDARIHPTCYRQRSSRQTPRHRSRYFRCSGWFNHLATCSTKPEIAAFESSGSVSIGVCTMTLISTGHLVCPASPNAARPSRADHTVRARPIDTSKRP